MRDAQTLLGKLADEGVIDPQAIGATGGSYGGGMSIAARLAEGPRRTAQRRTDPVDEPARQTDENRRDRAGIPVDATSPRRCSRTAATLDYVANAPYSGPLGDHRFGIQKQNWNSSLYLAGSLLGYYAPESDNDPEANITGWHNFNRHRRPVRRQPAGGRSRMSSCR